MQREIEEKERANQEKLKEQAEQLLRQMQQQREEMEQRQRRTTVKKLQQLDHSNNARKIKEANEICKALGLNMTFKQIFVKALADARRMTRRMTRGGGAGMD